MKNATLLTALLALSLPALSHAGGIDLKQILKKGLQEKDTSQSNGDAAMPGAGSAGLPPSLSGPSAPDIAGVRVGVSADEVRQQLQKLNPGYRFTPILPMGQTVALGFQAATPGLVGDAKGNDNFSVLYNEAGVVWAISRKQSLPKEKAILKQTLIESLKGKYDAPGGQVKYRDADSLAMAWVYDQAGRQTASFSTGFNDSPCNGAPYAATLYYASSLNVVDRYNPHCAMAITISTQALRTGSPNMIDIFGVQIVAPSLQHDGGALKAAEAARKQQQHNVESTVRDNKPQL
jgi:hypothetical protein